MNVRAALIFLVFGFVGLLLVMGVLSFVRWVRIRYPRRGFLILVALCVIVVGSAIMIAMEIAGTAYLPSQRSRHTSRACGGQDHCR